MFYYVFIILNLFFFLLNVFVKCYAWEADEWERYKPKYKRTFTFTLTVYRNSYHINKLLVNYVAIN